MITKETGTSVTEPSETEKATPESETLPWGSQGESDKCSSLGLTAVEFIVKSSCREARQRPKERGRERNLFKGKTVVFTQSE